MRKHFEAILTEQPNYSAANTPAMQRRGAALRGPLRREVQNLLPSIAARMPVFGDDLFTEARDGTGRKIELPWLRIASRSMSPNAREGFYVVIHFSTDGSAIHITLGCGSSRYTNCSFQALSDEQIDKQTSWARRRLLAEFGDLKPFDDQRTFGASRRLPKSFERATICSAKVSVENLSDARVTELLLLAADRLEVIYQGQFQGKNLKSSDQEERIIESSIGAVHRPKSGKLQGYGLSAEDRRLVELRAMDLAADWLKAEGFEVEDVSSKESYDLSASKNDEVIKVEVKGTTSRDCDAILMTANEVQLHRRELGKTGLIIVSNIELRRDVENETQAIGGQLEANLGWDIGDWELEPVAYRVRR